LPKCSYEVITKFTHKGVYYVSNELLSLAQQHVLNNLAHSDFAYSMPWELQNIVYEYLELPKQHRFPQK